MPIIDVFRDTANCLIDNDGFKFSEDDSKNAIAQSRELCGRTYPLVLLIEWLERSPEAVKILTERLHNHWKADQTKIEKVRGVVNPSEYIRTAALNDIDINSNVDMSKISSKSNFENKIAIKAEISGVMCDCLVTGFVAGMIKVESVDTSHRIAAIKIEKVHPEYRQIVSDWMNNKK